MTNGLKKIRRAAALGFRPPVTLASTFFPSSVFGFDVVSFGAVQKWISAKGVTPENGWAAELPKEPVGEIRN
jgi:hypothetical protein